MKTLIIHNEGDIKNQKSCSGTGYQVLMLNGLFEFTQQIDESKINSSYINEYNKENCRVIFVTRALRYVKDFESPEKIYWSHNYYIPKDRGLLNAFNKIVGVSTFHQLWLSLKFKRISYCINNTYSYSTINDNLRDFSTLSLAFVGSLNSDKGFIHFIDIVKEIGRLEIKCIVRIFGDGKDSNLINELNQFKTIEVQYFGKQPKHLIYKELNRTLFLLYGLNETGPAETFGLSFLDAQMCGCIPLTLNRGASYEIIEKSIQKFSICKSNKEIINKILLFKKYDLNKYSNCLKQEPKFECNFDIIYFKREWYSLFFLNKYPRYNLFYCFKYLIREFF